jgi:hypothetical protein
MVVYRFSLTQVLNAVDLDLLLNPVAGKRHILEKRSKDKRPRFYIASLHQ